MICKLITVYVKPGQLDDYLAAQEVWNRETQKDAGYVSHFCGRDPRDANIVCLQFFWRSREDLERWMRTEHDRIQPLAAADKHYDRIEVRILDDAFPPAKPLLDS